MAATAKAALADEATVTITRIFDAPRTLVWAAWTDPKQVAQWWGPKGFTNPVCTLYPRPGGAIWIVMRGPDGVDYPMSGIFHEVVKPERLVFSVVAEDAAGHPLIEGLTTVTFTEHEGKTTVTVRATATAKVAVGARMLQGMEAGWTQSLEKLEALLAQTRAAARST
jgi:uncharacterized protein YndB with AHSA1/START domain